MSDKSTTLITITRKIEFDAGHRIPQHESKCRHAHGHRYVLEATISGLVRDSDEKHPAAGMVSDFGDLKAIMEGAVAEKWDHAFLVFERDYEMIDALAHIPGHRTVVLPCVPTAENLVLVAASRLNEKVLAAGRGAYRLSHVRLYETPNCWADWFL